MNNGLGVYAKNKGGVLQRRLMALDGEATLPDSTPDAEVIDFSELSFYYYAVIIDKLITCQPFLVKKDTGGFDTNVYEFMIEMADDLVQTLEKETPLFGTLTRTACRDNLPRDDGTPRRRIEIAQEIIHTLTDVISCQFEMNEVLDAVCRTGEPALDTAGAYLKDMQLTEMAGLSNPLSGYYRFRSMESYYRFLLLRMIESKARVARCECCGSFFVPRTKAVTKYCDRVIRDGKTCKEIAPALKHKQQAERSKVIQTFDRVKQKLYKRYERAHDLGKKPSPKDLPFEAYYAWLDMATKARDDYLAGTLTSEQTLAVIEAEPVRGDATR